jgi:hypothetical protein
MNAYQLGRTHKKMGYSIWYNPFRHKGSGKEYADWIEGYQQ